VLPEGRLHGELLVEDLDELALRLLQRASRPLLLAISDDRRIREAVTLT
jgi:hypothetical protein